MPWVIERSFLRKHFSQGIIVSETVQCAALVTLTHLSQSIKSGNQSIDGVPSRTISTDSYALRFFYMRFNVCCLLVLSVFMRAATFVVNTFFVVMIVS